MELTATQATDSAKLQNHQSDITESFSNQRDPKWSGGEPMSQWSYQHHCGSMFVPFNEQEAPHQSTILKQEKTHLLQAPKSQPAAQPKPIKDRCATKTNKSNEPLKQHGKPKQRN